jgi:uncharacterized protein
VGLGVAGRRAACPPGTTSIGLANGPSVRGFLERNPGLVDYVELPFELLRHDPSAIEIGEHAPLVLHCASMSIGGFVAPSENTLAAIATAAERTATPWIGEHLAFITADPLHPGAALHEATTLSYTVCPQLSEEVLEQAVQNLTALTRRFPVPLLIENSPQYFAVPGSTMSIVDFTIAVHARFDIGMLLDLTHFIISSTNMGFDARTELERLPLSQLVELHISGLDDRSDTTWDDHSSFADDEVLELAEFVLSLSRPRAVTFEYNWAPTLPDGLLTEQITRIRKAGRG